MQKRIADLSFKQMVNICVAVWDAKQSLLCLPIVTGVQKEGGVT
jgi:hypothetical protein